MSFQTHKKTFASLYRPMLKYKLIIKINENCTACTELSELLNDHTFREFLYHLYAEL